MGQTDESACNVLSPYDDGIPGWMACVSTILPLLQQFEMLLLMMIDVQQDQFIDGLYILTPTPTTRRPSQVTIPSPISSTAPTSPLPVYLFRTIDPFPFIPTTQQPGHPLAPFQQLLGSFSTFPPPPASLPLQPAPPPPSPTPSTPRLPLS